MAKQYYGIPIIVFEIWPKIKSSDQKNIIVHNLEYFYRGAAGTPFIQR